MNKTSLQAFEIQKYVKGERQFINDLLSVEEPLGIKIRHQNELHDISVTMRTPGNDDCLSVGFLFTEGIIQDFQGVLKIEQNTEDSTVTIELRPELNWQKDKLQRNFYTTSSCGVCGKASIDAVKLACPIVMPQKKWKVSSNFILELPKLLRDAQQSFDFSGGIHAAAVFNLNGELIDIKEDVGRHNALDKLIGGQVIKQNIPMFNEILVLSGRGSFELVQKAAMAGIRFIACVGAPSSLAVELAEEYDITLLGFLKADKFNIYSGFDRVDFP
jgi:FdhD protein